MSLQVYSIVLASILSQQISAVIGAQCRPAFYLDLPKRAISARWTGVKGIGANKRETYARLEGPGCIKHLFVVLKHPKHSTMTNRKIIMRIYFDDSEVPHVEAPVGDFFGVMHGQNWYDVNNEFLSVKAWNGYNSYFEMPFASNARIEFETGPEANVVYLQVDWHRYPEQEMRETRRFCAQWRRECPTQRYGEDYLMLDADGPGQLVGFVYGVRLMDDTDRWSHGGADNIYIDGNGEYPSFIRGIGGEDAFGAGYGGALHPPETHLYSAIPYYVHEDTGEPRPAQRLVGYRFFVKDSICFEESIQMRFGCMSNDICSTVYWYQSATARRSFVKMPDWDKLLPGAELKRGEMDLPMPDFGSWQVNGPYDNKGNAAIEEALKGSLDLENPKGDLDWIILESHHGFIDLNHVFRLAKYGVGSHYRNKAARAICVLNVPEAMKANIRIAWDDQLIFQVNDQKPIDMGNQYSFLPITIQVDLVKGKNILVLTLSNTSGSNHGGWLFAFRAESSDGNMLKPQTFQ